MIIIAGYEHELNESFFSFNQGLKSRFPWIFNTNHYTADDLKQIFIKKVGDIKWKINIDDSDFFSFTHALKMCIHPKSNANLLNKRGETNHVVQFLLIKTSTLK